MRIADTSALYALFSTTDVHHDEALDRLRSPETVMIPSEIWSETISLIQYRQGFGTAVSSGKALLGLPHVELLPSTIEILRHSWNIYRRSKGDLSLPDCVVVAWCLDMNATPLTFDKEIASRVDAYQE